MKDFNYRLAAHATEANALGQNPNARFIAGGTLLVDLLRLNVERPELVVDLGGLEWTRIEVEEHGLRVGALVRNTELAYHPRVVKEYPALSSALLSGASPQIRNRASVGGNLLQRTRCAYFRDVGVSECNKRTPGSGCAAFGGYSRMHAVLGGSERCIAAHPSDMCVALLALDAVVHTQGPGGSRQIALDEFHTLPTDRPEVETVLRPGEIVTHVFVPQTPLARRSAYVKVRDRASFAFALAACAVALELSEGNLKQVRVALGGLATKPWRTRELEQALLGKPPSQQLFESVAPLGLTGARTTPYNEFKLELGRRVIVRALTQAAGLA